MPAQKKSSSCLNGGFFERVAAELIDTILLAFTVFPLIILFVLIFIGPSRSYLIYIFCITAVAIYNTSLLTLFGQTLGKYVMKLKVIGSKGQKVTFLQAILRETISKWVSKYILGLGFLWILIDKRRQGWHDKIAQTQVVKVNDLGNPRVGVNPPIQLTSFISFIILSLLFAFFSLLNLFVFLYLFIIQPHRIAGEAMNPALKNNQYIITDKFDYLFSSPLRGDIIVFKAPDRPDADYIKRIVGIPGDSLKIQNGKVYIKGKEFREPYLPQNTLTETLLDGFAVEGKIITIPNDSYFVLGDNREESIDSRKFGFVKRGLIIGKFWFRYY